MIPLIALMILIVAMVYTLGWLAALGIFVGTFIGTAALFWLFNIPPG